MTELEVYDALMLANEMAADNGQTLLTVLTGYLLITFFVGEKLTTFQVFFVNTVFLLTYASTWQSLVEYSDTAVHFRNLLLSMGSELPVAVTELGATSEFQIAIAILLTTGSLYFMWTVRHPQER